jgi:hypothetical protein
MELAYMVAWRNGAPITEGWEMLVFNGKKYAKNDAEFVDSLFQSGGTCNGYYKRVKHGVKLYDMQRVLTAFIVDNQNTRERFLVTAHTIEMNGKNRDRYMFGTTAHTERFLGVQDMGRTAQLELINAALNSAAI